ncbi:hypothetical protein PMIT1313_00722 [Prochlorococcus marinus str. MIT 1313]|nr:hypothetical protein PMIT1313_00722 [Prochlorococcus marinus str. MIT 1313]KZR72798.1 hypothetical protein PMIT1318_00761 [Prochlorococcus marinus str. MIT 1318]
MYWGDSLDFLKRLVQVWSLGAGLMFGAPLLGMFVLASVAGLTKKKVSSTN